MRQITTAAALLFAIVLLAGLPSPAAINIQRHVTDRAQSKPSIAVSPPVDSLQGAASNPGAVTQGPAFSGTTVVPDRDGTVRGQLRPSLTVPLPAPATNGCSTNVPGPTMHPACVIGASYPMGG
jgi:hypothetical protein